MIRLRTYFALEKYKKCVKNMKKNGGQNFTHQKQINSGYDVTNHHQSRDIKVVKYLKKRK
jgi:hypothetical protein